MGKKIDLTGKVFGEWVVLKESEKRLSNMILWDCRCSCGRVITVFGASLRKGLSKSCGKCKKIYGLAENDTESLSDCPYYKTWKNLLERTISPRRDSLYPSYQGVTICDEWLKLSKFKVWMSGKEWRGFELDKDLLVSGNKVYSPTTCAFIPSRINLLLGVSESKRGHLPLGVCLHSNGIDMQARCSGKYLGIFSDTKKAHSAWQLQKIRDIISAVKWWEVDHEVSNSFNRTIASNLVRISEKILHDNSKGIETTTLSIPI